MEDHVVVRSAAEPTQSTRPVRAIIYRSLADPDLDSLALGELLSVARSRNVREGLTGLLLFDGIHFVQWLEGPSDALARVWYSIQNDPRHSGVELMGDHEFPARLFRGWDMGLAGRSRKIAEGIDDVVLVDQSFFEKLEGAGSSLGGLLDLLARLAPNRSVLSTAPWADERQEHVRVLCLDHVLPIVQARHGLEVRQPVARRSVDTRLPRIDPTFIQRFVEHLRASDLESAERVWKRLVSLGCSPAALCSDLVEPTARLLGDLWAEDACSGADLAIAETELLLLMRRDTAPSAPRARLRQPKVLVTAMPGSHNVLGPALAAARLESLQCCTECLHPHSDDELDVRLVETDTHNLVIALDPSRGRSVEAEAIEHTIQAARAAVHNRGLRVMLYGRQVSEDPGIGLRAHADSAYATLSELNVASLEWSSF